MDFYKQSLTKNTVKLISLFIALITLFTPYSVIASDCLPNFSNIITCNDFVFNATDNVDRRISVMNQTATNLRVYDAQFHNDRIYVRNKLCWAYDFDMTCISPWNSNGVHLRAGTLITPRHVILAAHYSLSVNNEIRFITKANEIVQRKIIGLKIVTTNYYPDIEIATLDADVPSSIQPCQFLPSNYTDRITNNGKGIPALYLDQEEKALVADINTVASPQNFALSIPTNIYRKNFNESVITGDSGNPIFMIISGKLVLLGLFTWGGSGSGTSLTYYANLPANGTGLNLNLNDIIAQSDLVAGVSTGYKISYFDFNQTPSEVKNTYISDKVYSTGKTLFVELQTESRAKIEIFNINGQCILSTMQNDIKATYKLLDAGLYFVRISGNNYKSNYKTIIY